MDKRLYVAWNNFAKHELSCPKRCQWLDVFLCLALKHQEFRFSQFFRGMSSVLIEQLLYDMSRISSSQMGGEKEKLTYCLRRRGWLLLHALSSSNLRSLVGVADLADLLINLYGAQTEEEPPVIEDQTLWPLTDLSTVVTRSDLKNVKKPRRKQSRRGGRLDDIRITSLKDCVDGVVKIQLSDRCCRPEDDDVEDVTAWNEKAELPCLAAKSFNHLALSLLEQLVGHHGDYRLKSSRCLDHRVMTFALQRLQPGMPSEEQRRLFRLILRCMVSIVQHHRPLQAEEVIHLLIEIADASQPNVAADVIEGLVRFFASVHPIDDDVLFHQWLNNFHSQTCMKLVIDMVISDSQDLSWLPLIGTIIGNVSCRNSKTPFHHHHVFGQALVDPDQLGRESCSISSLFYILLQVYQIGNENARKLVLKAIVSGGHPCCCLPPDIIYQVLFKRVVEVPEFLDVLEVVFRSTGFASATISIIDYQCHFCRYNGGQELERCRQMGVYASTESLSKSCWNMVLPDPWRSFDFYTEYISTRMQQPFTLAMVKHIHRLIDVATTQVKSEIFARVFYPILTLPTSFGTADASNRSSIAGQITEACWQMTANLVRQRSICELFLSSNGLELLLDLCRSPEWSWNVARVLQSMIGIQCQSDEETDLIENVDIKLTGMGEATALAILEHLLVHHMSYILRSLESQIPSTDDCDIEIPELKAATDAVGSFDSVWVNHLKTLDHLPGNLKTASALWETTVRLFVHNRAFSSWFSSHPFVKWIELILPAICRYLSDPLAPHWTLYAELLELFLALSLLSSSPNSEHRLKCMLEQFSPQRKLSVIYEILLRCSTLERWVNPENPVRSSELESTVTATLSDGYEADTEPVTLEPVTSQHRSIYLFFPAILPQLLINFSNWLSQTTADEERALLFQEFLTAFQRMASICSHPPTATVLSNQGLLTILLKKLKPILISSESSGIRQQVIGMISCLGNQRITPGELQLLIDMLKEENPPWKDLLPVFLHLIRSDGYRPTYTLSFPGIKVIDEDIENSLHLSGGSIGSFVQVNDIRSEIYTLTKHAMELGRVHESKGIGSAWKCAAIFLPVLTDNSWNMQTDGLTLSTWLLLSEAPRRKGPRFSNPEWRPDLQDCTASFPWEDPNNGRDLHLFSMGTRSFLVEFWADPGADNTLLVRLSQSTHSQSQALATQTLDLKIPSGRWNHLVVSCRQRSSANGYHRVVHIQVYLNGYQSASLDLKVPLSPMKRLGNSHSFLLLGIASVSKIKSKKMMPSWQLGNATLYKGELLSAELAFLLMALGPNGGIFLATCQDGQTRPNFPRFLHSKLTDHLQDWDRLLEWNKMMDSLQSNLLLTYSAHKPESVFIYPYIISPTAGIFGSIMPSGCVFNAISNDPRSSQQPPIALSVAVAAPLTAHYHMGIHAAMKQLGGYPVLLFLLGHSIESKSDYQAQSLEILLHWLRSDAQEAHLFAAKRGYWMLQHVFEADRCRPGKDFAAVLLNLSCSSPVVTKNPSHHCDAIIVDPRLLSFTIQCWKHWQRFRDCSEGNTLDLVLHGLQHLLRDNHRYRDFNVKQMQRAGILELLLHLARESSLYEDCIPLTDHQAIMIADLVEGLIGSPPTVSNLIVIVDYLLLLHPAEQTYCPTNSAGFSYYFLLTARDPGVNVFHPRNWKLPEGYETYAPESAIPQPMNANQLGSALRDVIVKWSAGEKHCYETIPNNQTAEPLPEVSSSSNLSTCARDEADTTLSLHLLRVLIACIRVLPDSMVKQVASGIIRPDTVVIMARHKRDRMRAGAVRLLQAVLSRSEEEEQNFIKQSGLLLLANQLQPYAATAPVVESCVSLCVGVDVILEQVLDPFAIWPENPTPLQLQSTILLLSLLPNAALDPALFHQLATLVRTLATRSNHILKFLLDFGLVETMGKSIVALAHATKTCPGDILEQREDEILLEAIHRILILVATRTVTASGTVPWTAFQDIIQLFHYMERVESGRCGFKSRCVRMLHESCCVLLKQAIQAIQHRVEFHKIGRLQHQLFAFQPGTSHFQHVSDKVLNAVLPVSTNRKMKLDKQLSQSEILERFKFLLVKAVDHITLNTEQNTSTVEVAFSQDLFVTLVRGVSSILERPKSNGFRHLSNDAFTDWSHYYAPDSSDLVRTLYWNSRQTMKTQFNRLVLFLSSPIQSSTMLQFVIKTLYDDPHYEELFRLANPDEPDFTNTLDTYLCHFLHSRKFTDNVEHTTLIKIHCISRCLVGSHQSRRCQVLDPAQLKEQFEIDRSIWWRTQEEAQIRILSRYDALVRQTADVAAKWTTVAVGTQNNIRRLFLNRLRRDHGSKVLAAGGWIELVDQLTHQRAAWHFAKSYVRGWELDPIEGYQRMHLRLRRAALNVDAKYLLERSRSLLEPEKLSQPLESILRMSTVKSVDDVIGHDDEKVLRAISCWLVTTTAEIMGELVLTEKWMTFLSPESNQFFSCTKYEDVREILARRFQLQERALELFMCDNRTQFLVFNSLDERNATQRELSELCPKLIPSESLADVTQLWRESQITNFEYLVFLNKFAGRSYNDLMQYPIFPFVLADYESPLLDLNDPHLYRNFKKPMAVQNESRDQHYIENYNYLKRDFENRPEGSGPNFGPFHYGSLYSNPGIVLHFLVRLPPFTKLLMEYQDRNFDVPDRSFHSVGTSWRLASSDSTTDVKELIPEFFYLPEFLVNSLGFDFGMQQCGDPVDDVQLPPWSLGKPRLFIQIHRQALESSWVRDHLHHWIDLIFGFKQTGPAAIESINVFHPSTYAGFDATEGLNDDPIERNAKLTMIRSYGQVPRQLFRQPHPMSIQPLNAKSIRRSRNLLPSVDHLQWGCYVGSPSCQDPVLKHKESFAIPVHSFLPLRTGDTYSLGPFTTAILSHSYDKDSFLGRPTGILGVALISWGQSDGIVRIKIRKDEPVKPLFQSEAHDSVILCSTLPDYNKIWVVYRSGIMRVYPFLFDPLKPHFELTGPPTILSGHVGPLQQLVLCSAFSLAVSSGSDGSIILWDLHSLKFIRQLTPGLSNDRKDVILPVSQLAVSRNTADIACAVNLDDQQSRLELRSVNGHLIGMTTTNPLITSLCFSSAPEGISINVVAAGLSNGRIRLWDTWTLNVVRDIITDSSLSIVSLAYSSTSQHLLAARNDGSLLAWDSPHNHKKSPRYPPFINLTLQ
ncbi:lysosomal-trafficking regulator-like [Daphnia carinata]|uniref:lysosomal-trafficking regulator-like n=1 Tax=Daphnia carinata TaxID=120202 RepID=UPI0025799183|nr:lysosomal-trafficking regulator-like [Daphnia carinata]XP_057369284.1 lysosomal-trafficking regulator-like [Daphnia carinata]